MANTKVTTNVIADDAITTAKILDDAVTVAKMAANSVDSDQYVDGSIDAAHLAPAQTNITSVGTLTGLTVSASAGNLTIVSTGNSPSIIDLRANGTGDSRIYFDLNGVTPFAIGVDNSDSDKFKISGNYNLGDNDRFVIDSAGAVTIPGTLATGAITGTTATASGGTSTTALASTAFVQQELTTLIGGAPSTLNDLNELAAAINDDANYNSTLTTALATKLPLAGGTMTGNLSVGGVPASSSLKEINVNKDGSGGFVGIDIHNTGTNAADDAVISFETNGQVDYTIGIDRSTNVFAIARAGNLDSNQRLVIDINGKVGIGDSNPQDYLEINGSGSGLGGLTISNSTHNHAALSFARSGSATARIYTTEPDALHTSAMHFQTSDASGGANLITAMTIDESQNVGIGTASPGDLLTLKAASTEETMLMFENNSAASIGSISIHPSNGLVIQQKVSGGSVHLMTHDGNEDINLDSDGFIQFEAAGAEKMRITSTGVGIGTSTGVSDPVSRLNVRAANNHTTGSDREDLVTFHQGISAWEVGRGAGIRWVGDLNRTMAGISSYIFGSEETGLAFETGGATSTGNLDPTTRMVIDEAGLVGIGNLVPGKKLDVTVTANTDGIRLNGNQANASLIINNTGSGGVAWDISSTGASHGHGNGGLHFGVDFGTPKVTFKSDGKVGIGTYSPGGSAGNDILTVAGRLGIKEGSTELQVGTSSGYAWMEAWDGTADRSPKHSLCLNPWGGNVGIGTTVAEDTLHIVGGGYDQIQISSTNADDTAALGGIVTKNYQGHSTSIFQTYCQSGNNAVYWGSADSAHRGIQTHYFMINSDSNSTSSHVTTMQISSGQTTVTGRLDVNQNAASNFIAKFDQNSSTGYGIAVDSMSEHLVFWYKNGSNLGAVSESGGNVVYGGTSDYRLKENVKYDFDATTELKKLKPIEFNFKAFADSKQNGFLAHELQEVVPKAVVGEKDAVDDEGSPIYQNVDPAKLVPLLVKTIQELEARIAALEE